MLRIYLVAGLEFDARTCSLKYYPSSGTSFWRHGKLPCVQKERSQGGEVVARNNSGK